MKRRPAYSRALTIAWLLVASLAAAPALAQSFHDAVRSNVALGTSLCVDMMYRAGAPQAVLGNAGFVYRAVDRGVNSHGISRGTGHYFDAPAGTAKVEVTIPDAYPGLCTVTTLHLPEADVAELVAWVLRQKGLPTEVQSPRQWHVRKYADLPLILGVSTIGTNHRYEAPGTVSVSMSFPG